MNNDRLLTRIEKNLCMNLDSLLVAQDAKSIAAKEQEVLKMVGEWLKEHQCADGSFMVDYRDIEFLKRGKRPEGMKERTE